MPDRRARITPESPSGQLAAALEALREEFTVPQGFPSDVLAEAEHATPPEPGLDLRGLPFVTLDPPSARDLDQAFHIKRAGAGGGRGFTVRYAIADVPGFVSPGGALDAEARTRGQTLYLPDGSVPLHPPVLSEGRASLLPGQDRSAYVWTIALDADGAPIDTRVERALIRSRAQLAYPSAQRAIDRGEAAEPLALLREVGELRIAQERARGGASLNLPEEEIVRDARGYRIERRMPLPVEEWNAQVSLLTGMAAAGIMLDGGIGILRTMPKPTPDALHDFRTRVRALGQPWPAGVSYGEYLRALAHDSPRTAAILQAAASLFRGADYAAFNGASPETQEQAAIAAPYAHVTAPLRRLVDRWGLVICEALCADRPVPVWVGESLPELPALMRASSARAGQLAAAALDRVEAALLRDHAGEAFEAVVLEQRGGSVRVQIVDPPVTASCPLAAEGTSAAPGTSAASGATAAAGHGSGAGTVAAPGTVMRVRVVRADVPSGTIELAPA